MHSRTPPDQSLFLEPSQSSDVEIRRLLIKENLKAPVLLEA